MAGLKQIKSKITSIVKTQKVTKAMEAVSAAKMRKAQASALAGRAYARAAVSILARVSGSRELANHPLVRGAEANDVLPPSSSDAHVSTSFASASKRALYIVITSDKGLAGALNSAVLRATQADIKATGLSEKNTSIIAVGKKANEFFTNRGYTVEMFHPNTDQPARPDDSLPDSVIQAGGRSGGVTSEIVSQLVDESATRFAAGTIDVVKIVYQNFISTFEQRPTLRTIFPLSLDELQKVVGDIIPARGVFAAKTSDVPGTSDVHSYTIEPNEEEILTAILPRLASIFVYHALLESQASEHSARMVAMKSASDKADELSHAFTLQFNKARQAAITREVSEITGGMEAMAT